MLVWKVLTFSMVFVLIFSVQNSLALDEDDDETSDKKSGVVSPFSTKEKFEIWKSEQISSLKKQMNQIEEIDTEDEYVAWFDGFFPPCEMGVWKDYMARYLKSQIKRTQSLEFGGNSLGSGGGGGLPECLREYTYEKFNTLYDPRIHNVTNHSFKPAESSSDLVPVVVPELPVSDVKVLEVDVSEASAESVLVSDVIEIKQKKSFLRGLVDKFKDYLWARL